MTFSKTRVFRVFWSVADGFNKLLQIAALVVGGIWAGWRWQQETAPSLKTGLVLSVETESAWKASSQACIGAVSATIENIGVRQFSVGRVSYEMGKAKPASLANGESAKIIGSLPESVEPVGSGDFGTDFLTGDYVPKTKANQTIGVLFKPDIDGELWFKIEVFDSSNSPLGYWIGSLESCEKADQSPHPAGGD